jgi:hypothetical protein
MMRSGVIFLLLGLALAGCGTTYLAAPTREADQRAQAAYADCEAQRRSGALLSYRQAATCAQPKVLMAYKQSGYPYIDLVELELAARATAAERIDTGFASAADVDRDIAELERRIADERQRRRDGEMRTGGSAPYVPPQQLLTGLDTMTNRALPRSGANCFTVGSFNRCD